MTGVMAAPITAEECEKPSAEKGTCCRFT